MVKVILMEDVENSLKEGYLEEIATATANQINSLADNSRPQKIYLKGADQEVLADFVVKFGLALQDRIDPDEYCPRILTTVPFNEGYSVDVGKLSKNFKWG